MKYPSLSLVPLLACLFFATNLVAQTSAFPVTAAVQSLPPFTPSLSDWADPTANRLGLTLLLNDREEPGYQVRLRLKISGQGIELRTNPLLQPRPITLNFGQPVQLTSVDLREYFAIDNLDFIGYSREAYLDNGGLPPGTYSICFEAIDYDRGTEEAASREACTFVQASLLDPPVILTPQGSVLPVNPQNMVVQWQALHTASFVTNYDLDIYAMDETGALTPEQIFSIQQPEIETTTMGVTTAIIDNTFPQLQRGQQYFARVRAYDANGSDAFKNGGYSELAFFTYGEACEPPTGLTANVGGWDNANISWQPVPGSASYVVRYKENISAATNWYEADATTFNHDLTELEPSTEYLVQVQSLCDGTPGVFSASYSFTTDTLPFDPGAFDCGVAVDSFSAPTNQTPITSLVYGDQVFIGGFSMKVTSASQVFGDLWQGTGQVLIPFLGRKINVKFSALGINTDRYVYAGNAFQSGKIEDALNVKSPKDIAEEEANDPPRDFCDSIIVVSTGTESGSGNYSIGQNDFNSAYNVDYDDYNPNNFYNPYDPLDYTNAKNPYTEERPFPETSLFNPYNVFSPYDPTDYDNPINPWTAAFPYSGEGMLDKVAAFPTSSFPSGAAYGAANLPLNLGAGQIPIIIYKVQFTPTVAKMWTYASVVLPLSGKTVAFKGKGITFHPEGLQGESRMELATNFVMPIKKEVKMTLKQGKRNHITFDCNGLTGIGFDMDVEFCENYVVPVDPVTHTIKPGRVKFNVQGQADDWVHITAAVNMPPFALTKLPDWHFTVTNAILDFSDLTTPVAVQFPYDYQNPKCTTEGTRDQKREGRRSPEWVGIYLGEMTVKLPKKMTRDTLRPIEIGAYGMLIDEVGLTLNVYGTNLIPFNAQTRGDTTSTTPPPPPTSSSTADGGIGGNATTGTNLATNASGVRQSTAKNRGDGASAGGWDVSLDRLGIGFQYSKFKYVQFEGRVMVPVFDKAMSYAAHVQPPSDTTRGLTFSASYAFQVGLADTVKMSAMGAKVQLEPNSRIGIAYDGRTDQFYASATFNGRASFNPALSEDSQGTTARDTSKKDRFNIPQIRFQNFSVQTREPYLKNIGNWALEGDTQPDMGGFNIVLNEVGMFSKPTAVANVKEVAFGVDLTLNLTPSEDNGFGAGGKGYIISTVTTDSITKRQDWEFKKVRVDKLTVSYESPAFELEGLIKFYENKPVWGTGFKGGISIAVQPGISAAAVAQFGNIDGHRYFFADAKVGFTPGLPLGQTGMAIYGFGGGISYGMKRSGRSSATPLAPRDPEDPPPTVAVTEDPELDIPAGFFEGEGGFQDPETQPTAQLPDSTGLKQAFEGGDPANQLPQLISIPEELGVSLSGAKYTPDPGYGFGIKALLAFGTTSPEVFNGDIMLEVVFTSSGGLGTIALTGNGRFMTPPKTLANPNPIPQVSAYVDMQFDFIDLAFDAMMEVKVYVAEGILKGAYPAYVAGIGKIHADPNDWWIHIGTPTNPFKLDLDVTAMANMESTNSNNNAAANNNDDDDDDGPIVPDWLFDDDDSSGNSSSDSSRFTLGEIGNVGLLVSAYFDAGTQIPDFPPVPNEVLSVMPNITRPTANDIANLGGIMGGLHYKVSMPDLRFLIFYADLNAGIGADVMMTNYGPDARCAGNPDATEPIGFNGWYGTGQAYAYLTGALGLKIDFWGSPLQLEIATIGAAAVLQTRLPNPIWIKGALAGQYSVMNGLVAGRFDFEFEAGEQCDVIGGRTLEGFSVVGSLAPTEGATDISVFAKPQATFNVPIDAEPIVYKDDQGVYQYAKPILESITLRDADDNDIPGEVQWSDSRNSVLIRSDEVLPPNTELTFAIKVRFKVRPASGTDDDYTWLMRGANTFEEENASVTFTTGGAPDHIPEENVLYAYPSRMQTNLHPRESSTGYVQLDRGQGYLFLGQPGANISAEDYEQKIRFSQPGQTNVDYTITYNAGEQRVSFAIPPGLALNSSSRGQILNLPIGGDAAVDINVDSIRQAVDLQLPAGADPNISEVVVRKTQAQGVQSTLQVTSIYDLPFRTSQYATFPDKINALTDRQTSGISVQLNPTDTIYLDDGTVFITGFRSLDNLREFFNSPEGFDDLDLLGIQDPNRAFGPLVRTEARLDVTGDNWFSNLIRPMVYDPFPYDGIALRRGELPLGIPPVYATGLTAPGGTSGNNLTETDLVSNTYSPAANSYRLDYQIPYRAYSDFGDLQQQVNLRLANGGALGPDQQALSTWDYRVPRSGNYRVRFSYVLPGATAPSSTVDINLNYQDGPASKK